MQSCRDPAVYLVEGLHNLTAVFYHLENGVVNAKFALASREHTSYNGKRMGQIDIHTLLDDARKKSWSDQAIVQRAIEMARALWAPTLNRLSAEERLFLSAMGRLVADESCRSFVSELCEHVLRADAPQATEQLKRLLAEHGGVPTFFSSMGRLRLKAAAMAPRSMQNAALAEVRRVFRATFGELVLPTHIGKLTRRVESFAKEGISLALHPLSPEIASGREAAARYERYLQTILEKQAGVGITVQPWRLCPGLSPCSPGASAEALAEALTRLLEPAIRKNCPVVLATRCSDTLPIIVEAYKRVLTAPATAAADLALELPGYLKSSLALLRELVDWASARAEKGARPIKLLLVKGSHLDAERLCAATYGTAEQLCTTKTEAETAYALLINAALSSPAKALTPIVGTHELMHLCYAALRWARSGREGQLPICLTLGLGNHLARSFAKLGSQVTLVAGIASEETGEEAYHQYLAATVHELSRPGGFLSTGCAADPATIDWNGRARPFVTAGSTGSHSTSSAAPTTTGYSPGHLGALLDRAYVDAYYAAARAEAERTQADIPLTIAGEPCESPLTVIHRSLTVSGLVDYRFTAADYAAVDKALHLATAALARPRGSATDRAATLLRVARTLRKRSTEFAALLARDSGFTLADAQTELRDAIDTCHYYAHEPLHSGFEDGTTAQPLGVVVVAPGTAHPLADALAAIAPAWLAGNSIIYKPAPYTTLLGTRLAALLTESCELDLLCLPCVDNEIGERLMTDPRVNALMCTASPEQAGELGAKAPGCTIFAAPAEAPTLYLSAHSDWRAALGDLCAFRRSGQGAETPHLIIVHARVYDDPAFLPAMRDAAASLTPKPTWLEGADLGPLSAPPTAAARELMSQPGAGAEWLQQPHAAELGSQLWAPGICTTPTPDFAQAANGLPLLGLVRVSDHEEALHLQRRHARRSGRAIIYTTDPQEADTWQQQLNCPWLAINCCPTLRTGATPGPAVTTSQHAGTGLHIGGRNFAAALCHWQESNRPTCRSPKRNLAFDPKEMLSTLPGANAEDTMRLSTAADSISYWWEHEFGAPQQLAPVPGARATLSYTPLSLCLRIEKAMADTDVLIALAAALQAGCRVQLSAAAERPWLAAFAEQYDVALTIEKRAAFEADFAALAAAGVTVRDPAAMEDTLTRAAAARLPLLTHSICANGRLELLRCTAERLTIRATPAGEAQ